MDAEINGEVYSWANITVVLFGRSLQGILSIDYDDSEEVKKVRGRGKKAYSYVTGNYDANASITLELTEIQAIRDSLPKGTTIYNIKPFDVTIAYLNDDQKLITHRLLRCKFTKQDSGGKSGEVKEIQNKLPLHVAEIDWAA